MKISKKDINAVRRSVMQRLTKNVGKSQPITGNKKDLIVRKVLITRPNHRLGNLLIITPLICEVHFLFPDSKIDLFVKGNIAPSIFKNYTYIDRIIQLPKKPFSNLFQYLKGWALLKTRKYDLVINSATGSSSGRLSTLFARSRHKVFGDFNEELNVKYSDYRHLAKNSIYNLRDYLSKLGFDEITTTIPDLYLNLEQSEILAGKDKLNNLVQNSRDTICLFTNATGEKCYSQEWWEEFYDKLKKNFSEYNIIELLPVENISKLNFKIPHFYSRNIREMSGFLKNVTLFIAADNGVMHLASATGIPTIGLFSVSAEEEYAPYNGKSCSVNTNHTDTDKMMQLIHKILEKR